MQQLKFINARGREIVFADYPPFVFWQIKGTELPPVMPIETAASGQHGYTLHDVLLDGRVVRLTGHIHGKIGVYEMYEKRRELAAVCNPLLGIGELFYTNDFGTWRAPAWCRENPYTTKVQNFQTLDLAFECPAGFWQSAEPEYFRLGYISGGMKWPLTTPNYWGTVGYLAAVLNDGDAPAPFEMTLTGGSLNPVITNKTTGEFIRVDKKIQSYDKLYICTNPEKLAVTLLTIDPKTNEERRENAYGYVSDDSTLFSLGMGRNDVTFFTDDDNRDVKITGSFYKLYSGV